MAQIINDNPGIGSLLGAGLGQGIGSGLQQLAQLKTNQLLQRHQQRQSARGLEALGFTPQESQQIALLPQDLQGLVLKNYLQAAESAGLEQALRGAQVNPESESDISGLRELLAMEAPSRPSPATVPRANISEILGIRQPGILNRQLPSEKVFSDLLAQAAQPTPAPEAPRRVAQREEATLRKATEAPREPRNKIQELLRNPRLSPEQRLKVASLQQQKDIAQQRLTAKEREEVNKETKPVYDQIQKEAKAAKESDMRLDRMEHLIEKGDLSTPAWASIIKTLGHGVFGLGLDLSAALTADSQEFDKLSTDFLKGAKDIFGGRITNDEVKAFLRTVPSLTQSKEGKKRVIRNLRIFNEGKLARKKASDAILKANGGKRPRDYEQLIDELTTDQLNKLSDKFKNSSSGPEQYSGLIIE